MAAPSGVIWGTVVNDLGCVGIYADVKNLSDTTASLSVQIWFWSKYSVSDKNNAWYFDNLATPGSATTHRGSKSINTTVATGSGWSTSNQVLIGTMDTVTYTREASASTRYLYAMLKNVDVIGGNMYNGIAVTIPALPKYTITYNANGGSGAPSSQTKTYNKALSIPSTIPTRHGYTFLGWATSSSATTATYSPGANYTANAAVTLYAVWTLKTYTIQYNANGGSGAPSSQTKNHGTATSISATAPTRKDYTFLGWATSASSKTVAYKPGASYTANASTTLYAVWELAYVAPSVVNLTATRCNADGIELTSGNNAIVRFDWKTAYANPLMTITWESTSAAPGSISRTLQGTSGTESVRVGGDLVVDATYKITVTINDGKDPSSFSTTLNGSRFPVDYLPGGRGIGFGKPAELAGVADFGLAAKFNEPVFGNVLGLNKLPRIPANSDFNDYKTTGAWGVYKTADAQTIANIPCPYAGRLEVNSSTGEGILSEGWSYLRQRYIPYNEENATWERHLKRSDENVWIYTDWWRSSLTPAASKRAYHELKVLWSGGLYMQGSHVIKLGELITDQSNGIVLVFSGYDIATSTIRNDFMHSFFIPKTTVAALPGAGYQFEMAYINHDAVCGKFLYITNDTITGVDANKDVGSSSNTGITYNNKAFVLRYVLGV